MGRSIHPGAESHLFKTSELVENRAYITTDETPMEMCWDDEILPIQCRWEVFAGLSHTFRLFLGEVRCIGINWPCLSCIGIAAGQYQSLFPF